MKSMKSRTKSGLIHTNTNFYFSSHETFSVARFYYGCQDRLRENRPKGRKSVDHKRDRSEAGLWNSNEVYGRSIDGKNCSRNRDRILDRIRIRDHIHIRDRIRTWACYRNHLK